MYRSRCLYILYGYTIGPWDFCTLCAHWYRFHMVACAGGYCEESFQGFQGVTQGEPLYPIIFNMVVDAVVRHWISLVEVGAGSQDR